MGMVAFSRVLAVATGARLCIAWHCEAMGLFSVGSRRGPSAFGFCGFTDRGFAVCQRGWCYVRCMLWSGGEAAGRAFGIAFRLRLAGNAVFQNGVVFICSLLI
jgi:hypothetical protein